MICTEPSKRYPAQIHGLPLIKRLYIPPGVRRILIETAAAANTYLAEATVERFNPLEGCTVEISPDNPYLCVHENAIYSKDMTELFYIFSPSESFEVSSNVRRIKCGAGKGLVNLRRLILHEGVTDIEAGEELFEFVILGSVNNVFTQLGIDFTEYDKIFEDYTLSGWEVSTKAKYLAARTRLRYPYKMNEKTMERCREYVSDETEKIVTDIITDNSSHAGNAVNKEDLDLISDKGLSRLIENSVQAGKPEITTVLMEIMRERLSNSKEPE